MKPVLNKWQVVFRHGQAVQFYDPFVREVVFGIFRLKSFPEPGTFLRKPHYEGFVLNFMYKVPITRSRP